MEDLFRPAGQAVETPGHDDLVVIQPTPPPPPRRSRRNRILLITACSLVGVMVLVSASGYLWVRHLENVVASNLRTAGNPFADMDDRARPVKTSEAVDVLVLAADTRLDLSGSSGWAGDAQQLDAVLLVHIAADRSSVDVVTLPRLTQAQIAGVGRRPLSEALRVGGPSLLIATVEGLTGIRIDHLAAIDFSGFTRLTDALGGVDVTVPPGRPAEGTRFPPGTVAMDGDTALAYVREGDGRASDELIRARRQQSWLRAIATSTLSTDLVTHPGRLSDVLEAVASSLTVDATLTTQRLRSLAVSLRSVRGGDIRYATAPGSATRSEYVLSDRAERLWSGLRSDDAQGVAAALR